MSVERQLEAGRKYCEENSLTLSNENFCDLGISAYKNKKRDGFDDMIEAINSGRIPEGSYILIEAIDRLSRKGIQETQKILSQILEKGINIAFVGDDAKTLSGVVLTEDSLNRLDSIITIALAAELAYKESLRKAKLIKDAKARAREKAKQGTALPKNLPFWLKYDNEHKKYDFKSDDDKNLIKEIIELRQQGMGARLIAKILNDRKISSPKGKGWSHTTIRKVLSNPALCGDYKMYQYIDDKFVPVDLISNYFPKVVNKEEWLLLQSDLSISNKGKPAKENPFTGVLRCYHCGSGMTYNRKESIAKNGGLLVYEYHFCTNSTMGLCDKKRKIRDLIPALKKIMDQLKIEKVKHNINRKSSTIRSKIIEKTNYLDELIKILSDSPTPSPRIINLISEKESELNELKEALVKEDNDNISLKASDIKLLATITDAKEYNMHIRRLVKVISIRNIAKKNYAVLVKKRDGGTQSFIVSNGEIKLFSDTDFIKELVDEYKKIKKNLWI
ncbi:recombinase family protein [Limnobaculum parvum]|uniref:recombinase family protein n=1 Tax=Limnobaculum parvum TaxID=2172103 RepID=UPI001E42BC59|nr:recombinase family protein [Limnobaculum parvum]